MGEAPLGAHPLDAVVWNALTGPHAGFAQGDGRALRYAPEVAPFAAMRDLSAELLRSLLGLVGAGKRVALVTPQDIPAPEGHSVVTRDALVQMVWRGDAASVLPEPPVKLGADDTPEMLALTAATRPGPFGQRTVELGGYIGFRRDGRLVAMAGERMKLPGFAEVSAVCVDPAFRGQGLAADLIGRVVAAIVARSDTPFLHLFATNHAALALYRKLGFADRREMRLTVFARRSAQD